MISRKTIDGVVKIIIEEEKPEKIILFGSYSSGRVHENSDLDILIVKKTDLPKPKRAHRILKKLTAYPFNTDIIIKTPEEVKEQMDKPYSFVSEITKKGKVLYG